MKPRQTATPTVARVLDDGTLIELIHQPSENCTRLAVARPGADWSLEDFVDGAPGERLAPYPATNNLIASGCVLLPSELGELKSKSELVAEIRGFLRRYVDLSPPFEEVAAYYVLLSWVHDAFGELPYLRFRGDYGTGKTRALLTIGSVCYRPFFASGASTVSPIFHILDAFGGTLVLDEADLRFSDASADLIKILNNGNAKGMPVLRTMSNRHGELNPKAFRVFGPKLVAMRESFNDRALESRFLTEETGSRRLRADMPIHVPASLRTEAQVLRNRLLAWRFAARNLVEVDPTRMIPGIEPRLNQTALALLSLVDDPDARRRLEDYVVGEDSRVREDRANTEEAWVLRAVDVAFSARPAAAAIRISDVLQILSSSSPEGDHLALTSKRLGWVIRTRLRIRTTKSNGVYVIPPSERARVSELKDRIDGAHERISESLNDSSGVKSLAA